MAGERRSRATAKANTLLPPTMSRDLPTGTPLPIPETADDPPADDDDNPLSLTQAGEGSRRADSTIVGEDWSSGDGKYSLEYTWDILTRAEPIIFASCAIPSAARSGVLFGLICLPIRRFTTEVTGKFCVDRISNAEAWAGQHVGKEHMSPCDYCRNGYGPFSGKPCVVVEGYFSGSCAGCHYASGGSRCTFWKSARLLKAEEKGKSYSMLDGVLLTWTGEGPAPPTPARITRSRVATTPSRPSRTASASPPPMFSPAPAPRTPSPLRGVRLHSPAPRESYREIYEEQLNLARMLSRKVRILSRRQHDAAIAALMQVDIEEEEREEERREREIRKE